MDDTAVLVALGQALGDGLAEREQRRPSSLAQRAAVLAQPFALILAPEPGGGLELIDQWRSRAGRLAAKIVVLAGALRDGAELDDLLAPLLAGRADPVIASDLFEAGSRGQAKGQRLSGVQRGARVAPDQVT